MEEKNNIENLNMVLGIAKEEYNNYFFRMQALDVKIGLLLAFYGIIFSSIFNIQVFKELIIDINVNRNISVSNILLLNTSIINILIFIMAIFLLIYGLISKNARFVPISIFNGSIKNYKEEDLITSLIETTYKTAIKENNTALDKKHKYFNIACIFLITNILFIIGDLLLKL
ncbi:MAG: hypothetical protein FWF46_03345 [Oscillospiraceae bacterium]|nr:hypothetical protein [Oscillospiraceae bacterium]